MNAVVHVDGTSPTFSSPPEFCSQSAFQNYLSAEFKAASSIAVYVDTLQVMVPTRLNAIQLRTLQIMNKPGSVVPRSSQRPGWWSLRIQRPSRGVLNYIDHIAQRHVVSRVDIAVDLITRDQPSADRLKKVLDMHLRQLWHGKRKTNAVFGTTYYDTKKWNGRNIAVYSSKPSKVAAAPCAHLEFRFTRAKTCRRYGLTNGHAIQHADLVAILHRNFRLSALIRTRLDKRIARSAVTTLQQYAGGRLGGRFMPKNTHVWERRLRQVISRALGTTPDGLPTVPLQQWFENMRYFSDRATYEAPPETLINRYNCTICW